MNEQKPRILIVDDEQPVLNSLQRALRSDFEVILSLSGPAALMVLREQEMAVILSDQRMPEMNGADFFNKARAIQPDAVRIMITGYSDIEALVKAVNDGRIYYYIQKPWEPAALLLILNQAAEKYLLLQDNRRLSRELETVNLRLAQENRSLRQEVERHYTFDNIIGESAAIKKVFELMKKVLPTDTTVLLTGETGTGKELVAQAIHYNGPRSTQPFLAQNCAALPDTLLESILFGHCKGAFTDAISDRKGLFELADGGTVFLDEIADTSPAFQQRLLRVLQEGEITPVGSGRSLKVNVRIISATNRDPAAAVKQGKFREDLYYRLNVFPINLPPLRDRREDIPPLARYFIRKYALKMNRRIEGLSGAMLRQLVERNYPGNIRELENLIERSVVMTDDGMSLAAALPDLATDQATLQANYGKFFTEADIDLRSATGALEKDLIKNALERYRGNISRAARALGLSRVGLYKKLERLGIKK
ncbi:MAG: sigma-54 dependent transcriptional regulator [Candidatus Neomarinimicrobiota bacterium]